MVKSKGLIPILLVLAVISALLSNDYLTGNGGKDEDYKGYQPALGERGYDIKLGGGSTLNLATILVVVDGHEVKETTLHGGASGRDGKGPGLFAWGFTAKEGTAIAVKVLRKGSIKNGTRNGTINCTVLQDGKQVSAQASNDPYVSQTNCAWIVVPNP